MEVSEFMDSIKDCDNIVEVAKIGILCNDATIQLRSKALLYYADILQTAVGNLFEVETEYEMHIHKTVEIGDVEWIKN